MWPWIAGEQVTAAKLKANAGDYQTAGGSANAITVTAGAATVLTEGDCYVFKAANTNTGAVTFQVNAITAVAMKKKNGMALVANDIKAGDIIVAWYDGASFFMINPTDYVMQSSFELQTFQETLISSTDPTTFVGLKVCMSADGQDIYLAELNGANPNKSMRIVRYTIDVITGEFAYVGTAVAALDQASSDFGNTTDFGIGCSASFFWLTALNTAGTGICIHRYTRALASHQLMTISGASAFTTGAGIAGDDTNLWVFKTGAVTVQKFTVSGNTATVSTTFNAPINGDVAMGPFYDGTDILYVDRSATGNPVTRINTSGASQGTTTMRFWHANTGTTLSWSAFEPDPISCGGRVSGSVYSIGIEKPSTTGGAIIRAHAVTKP